MRHTDAYGNERTTGVPGLVAAQGKEFRDPPGLQKLFY